MVTKVSSFFDYTHHDTDLPDDMSCTDMGIYLAWVKNFKATSYETTKAFTEHLDERWKFSFET